MRWSDEAKSDLRAIYNFIARDSIHYARKVTQDLIDKADSVDGLPRLGRIVPELDDDRVREIPAYSYRIIYEIRADDEIVVLAIVHKRRNLRSGEK